MNEVLNTNDDGTRDQNATAKTMRERREHWMMQLRDAAMSRDSV